MRVTIIVCVTVVVGLMSGCSDPHEDAAEAQERSYEAQTKVSEERIKLVDQYKVCVTEAAGDNQKVEACDSYLKAAESLK